MCNCHNGWKCLTHFRASRAPWMTLSFAEQQDIWRAWIAQPDPEGD